MFDPGPYLICGSEFISGLFLVSKNKVRPPNGSTVRGGFDKTSSILSFSMW